MLRKIHDAPEAPEIDPGIVDSKRLQMFYASVKEGSFAAAAQMLSVSPSAISHAMKGLEEDLGCALFRRSGPQVKPTGAAIRLLPMVEDLLVRLTSIKSELAALDGRAESLTMRMPASFLGMLQAGILSTFCECFPASDIEIAIRDDGGATGSGKLVDFEMDYLQRVPEGMVRRDLTTGKIHAYVAPFHVLGQKSRISTIELKRCLSIIPDSFMCEWLSNFFGPGGELRKWIVPDSRAALELALQGQGIAFLPEWAVGPALRDGNLVRLKLPGPELRQVCCAWWNAGRPLTWVAEVFLSLLTAKLGPDWEGNSITPEAAAAPSVR